jgi:hypothetical protein
MNSYILLPLLGEGEICPKSSPRTNDSMILMGILHLCPNIRVENK